MASVRYTRAARERPAYIPRADSATNNQTAASARCVIYGVYGRKVADRSWKGQEKKTRHAAGLRTRTMPFARICLDSSPFGFPFYIFSHIRTHTRTPTYQDTHGLHHTRARMNTAIGRVHARANTVGGRLYVPRLKRRACV